MPREPIPESDLHTATTFSVEASSELAYTARRRVTDWAIGLGCMTDDDLCDMTIAVGEAFANIVNHGAHGQTPVRIHLERTPERVSIIFEYRTEPFNPTPEAPSPDDMAMGGYGLYIIRSLMDLVDFEFSTGQVRVRLEKHCRKH